jgi:hypothetical protein
LSFSCYVYYRVSETYAADASVAARQITERMCERTGVTARLMQKVGEPLMWMEVYEGIRETDAFLSSLQDCLEQVGFEHCLQVGSERHIEMFQCA